MHDTQQHNTGNKSSGKTTPWASQDIPGYPCIDFVDLDNPG